MPLEQVQAVMEHKVSEDQRYLDSESELVSIGEGASYLHPEGAYHSSRRPL
eukprot:CAMPEP_0169176914 /NCGR_PEP_ID=MMETSP1015-20121227/66209_1 /TAXON_ID=342587 /ORGANISM="Karlodinium micrum, Strain CCMP2283" /LENGTH=50 /DNA_ID=CAMNT_0009251623 /DNA_START=440 /DNA_END=588 /DNA_ORIENTATION=+